MMYWGQGGVERNIDDAFEMQHAAAAQNHPDALFDTGVMMLKGHGTTKNVSCSSSIQLRYRINGAKY